MFCGVRLSFETVPIPEVVLFPLLLYLLPMPISPACYAEVQNIVFAFATCGHFLIFALQVGAGKTAVVRLKNYQFFVNSFLRDVIFERYKIQPSWHWK